MRSGETSWLVNLLMKQEDGASWLQRHRGIWAQDPSELCPTYLFIWLFIYILNTLGKYSTLLSSVSCSSNYQTWGGGRGCGNPQICSWQAEVQVAWGPHLWLLSEVNKSSLVGLTPYPVESALTSGNYCYNWIKL